MNLEKTEVDRPFFARWVLTNTLGWLVGVVLVVALAMIWDIFGSTAQFMVGIGMGAGVGFAQARMVKPWIDNPGKWFWVSIIAMGIPFALWDLTSSAEGETVLSMKLCVLIGSTLMGALQAQMLRPRVEKAFWWIPACIVGWGLPVALMAAGEANLFPGVLNILAPVAVFLGGVLLGAVTGGALLWMTRSRAASALQ